MEERKDLCDGKVTAAIQSHTLHHTNGAESRFESSCQQADGQTTSHCVWPWVIEIEGMCLLLC